MNHGSEKTNRCSGIKQERAKNGHADQAVPAYVIPLLTSAFVVIALLRPFGIVLAMPPNQSTSLPVTMQVSSTVVHLHVIKNRPVQPATIHVTASSPGVPFSHFLGVSQQGLSVTQSSAVTPGTIEVTADPAIIAVGYNSWRLDLNGPNGLQIAVRIFVDVASGAPLDATPPLVDVSISRGQLGRAPISKAGISFTSPAPLEIKVSADQPWITGANITATTPVFLAVTLDDTLAEGTYEANITATYSGQSLTIPVTYTIRDVAQLVVSKAPINFSYTIGGPKPPPHQVQVTCVQMPCPKVFAGRVFAGVGPSVNGEGTFLRVSPKDSIAPTTLTVTPVVDGLAPGTYDGTLNLTADYPSYFSRTFQGEVIRVVLQVLPDPHSPR